MKDILLDLGQRKVLEFLPFGDAHVGSPYCDKEAIDKNIDWVKADKNRMFIGLGDLMDNATVGSVSCSYSATMTPHQQVDYWAEKLWPIRKQIMAMTEGNHELRTYKQCGIHLTKLLCEQLGIEDVYSEGAFMLFVKMADFRTQRYSEKGAKNGKMPARRSVFTIYGKHGSGGGGTSGGKVNRIDKMINTVDCDVYLHAHTHMPFIKKGSIIRVDRSNCVSKQSPQLFVNCAAMLKHGGYGEAFGFSPCSTDTPKIVLRTEPVKSAEAFTW